MDFCLSEEQKMMQGSLRRFLKNKGIVEIDRKCDKEAFFPRDLWKEIASLGIFGIPVPCKYGGTEGTVVDMVVVQEELGWGMADLANTYIRTVSFMAFTISKYGTAEQKEKYLTGIVEGDTICAGAFTEPSGGTDLLGLSTNAFLESDHFVVNGEKIFLTGANHADYIIALVRTDRTIKHGKGGLSLLIIDTKSPGLEVRLLDTLGFKAAGTCQVFFDNVKVPRENLLGDLNEAWKTIAVHMFNNERIMVAASAIGIGRAAFEQAVAYAKERTAFGRPIGQYQAIQHYLADVAMELECARLLTYKAAELQSQGIPCGLEATMAKVKASEAGFSAAHKGMKILAGYGYTKEFDMERYFRGSHLYMVGPIANEMGRNLIAEYYGLPRSY
jgi:acyl-CoA dehydrogenase